MKKIDKSQSKEYLPLVLYIEEIEEILNIVGDIKDNKVTISTDEYEFDSLSELCKHYGKRSPKSLYINFKNPYGSIDLKHLEARLYISSSTIESCGLFHKLDSVLSSAQRWPKITYSYLFLSASGLLLTLISQFISQRTVLDTLFGFLFIWYLWVVFLRLRKYSTIVLDRLSEKDNIFKRNSDSIVVALIGAAAGTIFTLIFTKLFD